MRPFVELLRSLLVEPLRILESGVLTSKIGASTCVRNVLYELQVRHVLTLYFDR
jgi:hypothetical protein